MPQTKSKPRPTRLLKAVLGGLLPLVLGGALGAYLGHTLKDAPAPASLWVLALLPPLIFAAIAWHELGHVAGGWISGFRLYLYTAGPLRIEREGKRLRWRFNRDLRLWGGVASTIPAPEALPSPGQLRRGMFRMTAGGPLFSLLGTLLLVPGFALRATSADLAFMLLIAGATSGALAVATLLPFRTGGFLTDGARLLQFLRGAEGDNWCAIAMLASLSVSVRPREWPAALLERIAAIPANTPDGVTALWLRHSYHADREDWAEARATLDAALASLCHWPPPARGILHLAAAFFFATHAEDAAAAREHFDLARKPGLLPRNELHLIEAAVLQAEGRHDEARLAAARAEASLASKPPGAAAPAREYLEALRQSA